MLRFFKVKGESPMDYTILLIAVVLTMFGILMVFSASYLMAATEPEFNYDTFYFLKRSSVLALIGLFAMFIAANIKMDIIHMNASYIFERGAKPWTRLLKTGYLSSTTKIPTLKS